MVTSAPRDPPGWTGRLVLSPGRLLFIGPAGSAEQHAHYAIQLVVGLQTKFALSVDSQHLERRATVVRSNESHAFDSRGNRIALLLLDSRDPTVRRLAVSIHSTELWSRVEGLELPSTDWPLHKLSGWADLLLARIGAASPSGIVSGPTKRALAYVDEALEGMPRLAVAAKRAELSPSRLSHLFRAEVGVPFRSFILWARLRHAAEVASRGSSLTDCALAAGFSDSAHFSRTFRDHFGLPPSFVLPLIEHAWPTS